MGVEGFRFSRAEIERFFEGKPTRRQLIEAEARTGGWPVALMVYRSEQADNADTAQVTSDFVRVRLLRGLSKKDLAFVCELAVFDWIDSAVVDLRRKRSLHAGIARALALLGQFLPAWRHIRSAGDDGLLGELFDRATYSTCGCGTA